MFGKTEKRGAKKETNTKQFHWLARTIPPNEGIYAWCEYKLQQCRLNWTQKHFCTPQSCIVRNGLLIQHRLTQVWITQITHFWPPPTSPTERSTIDLLWSLFLIHSDATGAGRIMRESILFRCSSSRLFTFSVPVHITTIASEMLSPLPPLPASPHPYTSWCLSSWTSFIRLRI